MARESIKSGITAGFAASAAAGVLVIVTTRYGVLPDFDPIRDIVSIADKYTGLQFPSNLGWVVHFLIGSVVWGILYALTRRVLAGPAIVKGLIFGLLTWFAMMIVFMPLAGHGFFGLSAGWIAPAAALVFNLIFGAVLAAVYASIRSSAAIDNVTPA